MKLTGRLTFALTLFGLCLFVVNEYIQQAQERQFQQDIQARFEAVSTFIVGKQSSIVTNTENLKQYAERTGTATTLYNPSGQVKYSTLPNPVSFQELKAAENHAVTLDGRFIYWETMKGVERAEQIGFMAISVPKPDMLALNVLYVFLFLTGVVLIFFNQRLNARFNSTLEEATNMAESLALGNYKVRVSESDSTERVMNLNYSLNVLARNLKKMTKSYQSQQDRLRTLIENIGNGLIFIDAHGRINLVNKTYRETFHQQTDTWMDEDYRKVIPQKEIIELIDETFLTEKSLNQQIKLPIKIERRHFDVSCAPVLTKNRRLRGILIVFHDITELKKLEQMRRDFVANVSHELKTPITSITGFAETLLDGTMDDKELETKFLTIILKESKRLHSLIHDLLELSKIEGERFEINKESVYLKEIVDETILILQEKAENKRIDVNLVEADDVNVVGDSYRIRQILINLINNAISYTPEGGTVTLKVIDTGAYVKLVVSDTGIGMDEDEIPRIFERFYRVNKDRSRNSGGTGLGLAIVKHLLEAHDGDIHVESKKGVGTTFTIHLPKVNGTPD